MLITLQPWLRGEEPKVRTVESTHIVSIERQGTRVEVTTANSQIFIEHFPNDDEAARRYDELVIKWATATVQLDTALDRPVDTEWIKLGAYWFKTSDIKYIRQYPSGIKILTHDGDTTDIIDITEEQLQKALLKL